MKTLGAFLRPQNGVRKMAQNLVSVWRPPTVGGRGFGHKYWASFWRLFWGRHLRPVWVRALARSGGFVSLIFGVRFTGFGARVVLGLQDATFP